MKNLSADDNDYNDGFVVHLVRPMGEPVKVASLELIMPDLRNRYSFKEKRSLEATFVPSVTDAINDALVQINSTSGTVSIPEFSVVVPDLALSGLNILITHAQDGTQYLMLRFRQFIGSIKRAFRFETSGTIDSDTIREKIAVEVLNDIVTPLFDIMSLNGNGLDHLIENHSEVLRNRINELSKRQEEITFYISMLQRYVAGCKSDGEQRDRRFKTPNARLEQSLLQ